MAGVLSRVRAGFVWLLEQCVIAALIFLAALPTAIGLLVGYIKNPTTFRSRRERSQVGPDPPPGFHHKYMNVNGVRLHMVTNMSGREVGGPGARPLMLLLHGFPEFWYTWRHQLGAFGDGYDVVAVDMRGYNTSDKPQEVYQYSLLQLAADIKALVEALGRRSCVLVGHDWGAITAWSVATLHPEVVEKLVVACGPHPAAFVHHVRHPKQLLRSIYAFYFQLPLLPELALSNNDFAALDAVLRTSAFAAKRPGAVLKEDVAHYQLAVSQPGALTAAINYYRALLRDYLRMGWNPQLHRLLSFQGPKVTAPVLMVWANQDKAVGPKLLEGAEQLAPDVTIHTIDNCSHWMPYDQPDILNSLIKDFLARPQAASPSGAAGEEEAAATLKGGVVQRKAPTATDLISA